MQSIITIRKMSSPHISWDLARTTVRFFSSITSVMLLPFAPQIAYRIFSVFLIIYAPILTAAGFIVDQKYPDISIEKLTSTDLFDRVLAVGVVLIVLYSTYAWIITCLSYTVDALIDVINDWEKTLDQLRVALNLSPNVLPVEIGQLRNIIRNW